MFYWFLSVTRNWTFTVTSILPEVAIFCHYTYHAYASFFLAANSFKLPTHCSHWNPPLGNDATYRSVFSEAGRWLCQALLTNITHYFLYKPPGIVQRPIILHFIMKSNKKIKPLLVTFKTNVPVTHIWARPSTFFARGLWMYQGYDLAT